MSENKLIIQFNNKHREDIKGTKILTPVVLSNSKGNWLKQQISHPSERELKWWCKCSSKSYDSLRWLRRNIKNKIHHLGNISLYVWLGACDLTTNNNKYISLTSFNDKIIESVVDNFKEIIELFREHQSQKSPFLNYQSTQYKHGTKKIVTKTQQNSVNKTNFFRTKYAKLTAKLEN
jgi:hypothetical protein